jgi:hypothetical protein
MATPLRQASLCPDGVDDCPEGTLRAGFFVDTCSGFSRREAQEQFDIAMGWGRYAELFDSNSETDEIATKAVAGASYAATASVRSSRHLFED